jgi:hypothetical protein
MDDMGIDNDDRSARSTASAHEGDDLGLLADTIGHQASEVRRVIQEFVDERPLTAVGLAFGLGYLLSGALVSRTTVRLLAFGGRWVVGRLLRDTVASAGLGLIASADGGGRWHHEPSTSGGK